MSDQSTPNRTSTYTISITLRRPTLELASLVAGKAGRAIRSVMDPDAEVQVVEWRGAEMVRVVPDDELRAAL